MLRPLALTLGEPAGIGPDITFTAWRRRAELNLHPFYLLADPQFLAGGAHAPGLPIAVVDPAGAVAAFETALPVVDIGLPVTAEPGRPDQSSAPAALAAIRRAVADVATGAACAVVTNPVAKNVLYRSGFTEPGHTEYLAKLAEELTGIAVRPVMMLWSPELAVVPVTIHLPLKEVVAKLTTELVAETARIVARDLRLRFGVARPRLAVAGLNPHAGEEGALGEEDLAIVRPAVERLKAEGIDARGPLPADTLFHRGARETYDVALAMYHDQALIPIKTLAFDHAVNVDTRPAVRAHFTRSRHRIRHRRHRPRPCGKPDRGDRPCSTPLGHRRAAPGRVARPKPAKAGVNALMSAIDDLPPLREVIRRHGLNAKKSLGQNFLLDLNLTARIARAAGPLDGIDVVEIGPGPGGLTRALLAQGARRVIAVERDDRAIAALEEIAARYPDRLEIIAGDALDFDPLAVLERVPARVVANLPYNIATALLVSWLTLEPWPPWYDRLVLMFQREVAQRIISVPGSKTYGRLSVLAVWRSQARILFEVAASAFVPPPKVTSSLVELIPRRRPLACDPRALQRVTGAAFGQRRKMLRQSLKSLGADALALLAAAGIDPTARAEDIPVEGFVALARAFTAASR